MGDLKKIFEVYKRIIEIPTQNEIDEIFNNIKPEEIKDENIEIPKVKSKNNDTETKDGDIIQIYPSVDGLDMEFVVIKLADDIIRLVLFSKFIEFATPKDVIAQINGEEYMIQTDLYIDIYDSGIEKALGRKVIKIGRIDERILDRIIRVMNDEEKGDGTMTTPTKGRFKMEEAKRLAKLMRDYIEDMVDE